jgi:rRNA-processing protein FCF1
MTSFLPPLQDRAMRSPKELRAEVRRLHIEIRTAIEPALKRELASRALELAMRAEVIANLPDDCGAIQAAIARYKSMLVATKDRGGQRVIRELLQDIEYEADEGARVA